MFLPLQLLSFTTSPLSLHYMPNIFSEVRITAALHFFNIKRIIITWIALNVMM